MKAIEATIDTNAPPIDEVIAEKVRGLPPERQREVLDFVESLARQAPMTADEARAEDSLIERHIDRETDDRGPAYARLAGYGTPVWALIGYYLGAVNRDVHLVARDYDVPLEAVEAALAYYRRYKPHIDAVLIINEALPGT